MRPTYNYNPGMAKPRRGYKPYTIPEETLVAIRRVISSVKRLVRRKR